MKSTAHDAGGTAPTSSTLHDDINELCVRITRLCLNTKQAPEGKELSKETCQIKSHSTYKNAGHISQQPRPPLDMKRKRYDERLQNEGSQGANLAHRQQCESILEAKKICRSLPVPPASLLTKSFSYNNTIGNGKKQAQLSCAPALTLAEQQSHPKPVMEKQDEAKKPSGKRKCKTKHLDVQMRRKRSFLAMDDPFDIEDTQDMVALPNKMMKQGEPTFHHGSLPATICQQKLRKQLQQPPSLLTI